MANPMQRSLPRVTVVIPAFNAAATLREAVRSCLAQTEGGLEVLIIEDGSRDATLEVAQVCQQEDPARVTVLRHEGGRNAGVAASRNLGISQARGEFVAFLDSDDVWLPDKLRMQLEVVGADPGIGFVFGNVLLCVDPDPARPMSEQKLEPDPFRARMAELFNADSTAACRVLNLDADGHRYVPSPTPLVRRELFAQGLRFVGPDRLRLQYEDFLMWKILAARTRVHCLAQPLAIYRVHASSFTGQFHARGSALRHLQGLSDVHEVFVDIAARDVEPKFVDAMFALQAEKIVANAHRIDLSDLLGYLLLAGKYRTAGLALARVLHTRMHRTRASAAAAKRSILGQGSK